MLLAGGQDILWVVRCGEGEAAGKFDLIIRRPGGKWQTLQRFSGNPAAVATWAYIKLHLTSDAEQPELLRLRRFLDHVADRTQDTAQLQTRELTINVPLSSYQRHQITTMRIFGDFARSRAMAHARTMQLEEAEAIAKQAVANEQGNPFAWEQVVRVLLWRSNWGEAATVVAESKRRFPDFDWRFLEEAVSDGRRLSQGMGDLSAADIERVVALSRYFSEMGLPILGRRVIQLAARGRTDVRLVHGMVFAHIADKRFDLARQELQRARPLFEGREQEFEGALSEVRARERAATLRRDVGG